MTTSTALIVDIVASRRTEDRAAAQAAVHDVFAHVNKHIAPLEPLWSTAGDEFQAMYASPELAAAATTLVRLASDVDVRFGIGTGESSVVSGEADDVPIYDGTAWWNARRAIDTAHKTAGKSGTARTWVEAEAGARTDLNAALLLRDELIGAMKPRERRIAHGLLIGEYQQHIADREGISQSAVSQSAKRSGAATLGAVQQLWIGRV